MRTERVHIAESAWVASTARVGEPFRPGRSWDRLDRPAAVGERCEIAHFSLIGEESQLGADCTLDAYCWIEDGASVGDRVVLTHRASVGANAVIGDGCAISAATIAARSRIGDGCQVYGDLVHRRLDPGAPLEQDAAPVLEDRVFVGWGAKVVGGVTIGRGSYVCAGATVTKDVAPGMIVTGVNEIREPDTWTGALAGSAFFAQPAEPVQRPAPAEAAPEPEPQPVEPEPAAEAGSSRPEHTADTGVIELPKTSAAAARARERSRLED
ncbi:DapH/DapD/GlmU-related protein [Saccharopolyspora griseoalba]|uniref:DapH/DapD/GlmU-related protein n=1 Tax=Saccharopolyspora griseoalba TaxID=1431848 RepID=A0ABW2LJV0_9PSEU